jgi:hypothetical protein
MDDPKPVMIGTDVVGQLFAALENSDDVVAALRARMEYIGASFGLVEQLADLSEGSLGKYLAPLQVKRLTVASLLRISQTLGIRTLFYVDPKLVARMKPLWTKRDARRVRAKRQVPIGQAQLRRLLPAVASEMGARGGRARMAKLTHEQRREIDRLGAQRRWHKPEAAPDQP